MKNILFIPLLLVLLFLTSCGPNQDKQAALALSRANSYLVKNDTTMALSVIDSALVNYTNAKEMRAKLEMMKGDIYTDLCNQLKRGVDSCDIIIRQKLKDFVVQDRPYDKNKWYVYKRQTFKRSWDRSFIEVNLNDKGLMYLTSNYIGEKSLDHTGIRVYDKDLSCKTSMVALNTIDNHHSDFLESKWEKVSYKEGASDDLISFIVSHPGRHFKAVFLGKKYYYILLEKYDIEAVVKSYELSQLLKQRQALKLKLHSVDKQICKNC
ncbi:hypothetical protein K5X82_13465 [Halosquirtibacter xylanolyticus]|uniref:hypothetical protein n=1 Tax=Halosquirtibacter xylanolyticus TaxID=3374599 RepID=UPI003749AF28|nr:hypothetical protein K5X82_13465 [Prolixibacteraceae bacterium]